MSSVRNDQLDIIDFAVIMAREFPKAHSLPANLAALMKECRRHAKLMERECNTGDVKESTVEKLEKRIATLCVEIDSACVPQFQGDPRGATVKLKVPSGKTNDWGAVGICVPGS